MKTNNTSSLSHAGIITELRNIVEPLVRDGSRVDLNNDQLHLITEMGLESVDILGVILGIEKTFGIVIAADELDMQVLAGLENLARLIEDKLHENN